MITGDYFSDVEYNLVNFIYFSIVNENKLCSLFWFTWSSIFILVTCWYRVVFSVGCHPKGMNNQVNILSNQGPYFNRRPFIIFSSTKNRRMVTVSLNNNSVSIVWQHIMWPLASFFSSF